VRTSAEQRERTEARIRAAIDRLLRGDLPPGSKCDAKTLAAEAGISRAALYSTYAHLKDEFEQRRARLRATGTIPDPRQAQIENLKQQVTALRDRVAERDRIIAELTEFRATAVSQLATQHDEIQRLRANHAGHSNVRALSRPASQPQEPRR
jgi:chromosome segregation ATPase